MQFNSSWNFKKQVSAKYSNSLGKTILRNSIVEEVGKCQWGFFGWHSGILHTFCIQLAAQNTQLCDAEAGWLATLKLGKTGLQKIACFSKFLTFPESSEGIKRSPIRMSNQDFSCPFFIFTTINEKISLNQKIARSSDKYKFL